MLGGWLDQSFLYLYWRIVNHESLSTCVSVLACRDSERWLWMTGACFVPYARYRYRWMWGKITFHSIRWPSELKPVQRHTFNVALSSLGFLLLEISVYLMHWLIPVVTWPAKLIKRHRNPISKSFCYCHSYYLAVRNKCHFLSLASRLFKVLVAVHKIIKCIVINSQDNVIYPGNIG